jgi:hypothetical protein
VPYVLDGDGNCHVYVDEFGRPRPWRPSCATPRRTARACATRLRPCWCTPRGGLPARGWPRRWPGSSSRGRPHAGHPGGRCPRPRRTSKTSSWNSSWPSRSWVVDDVTRRSSTSPGTARGTPRPSSPADVAAADRFVAEVDAAAVLVNASTRFVDGGGARARREVGISTQKLHARGPMGLRELTCREVGRARRRAGAPVSARERTAPGPGRVGPPRVRVLGRGARAAWPQVGYLADEAIAASSSWPTGWPSRCWSRAGRHGQDRAGQVGGRAHRGRLIRLQCYEGLDESKALYEWNYRKQLLRIQAGRTAVRAEAPGGEAGRSSRRTSSPRSSSDPAAARGDPGHRAGVLLVDEVDRVELETEALLLEILSEYQVSIPELGTVRATQMPLVFLTSNNTRELSEALKRRCLYLHIDYPTSSASARSSRPGCRASARSWPTRWPGSCARCAPWS